MNGTADCSTRWSVLIGVNSYHESLGPLQCCVNDAKLLRDVLLSEVCGFAKQNVLLLCDGEPQDRVPTYGNIHSWLGTWLSRPKAGDLVLVYFAGHGREVDGRAMLVPQDATLDSLNVTGIPIDYVRDLLERCDASQKVLILDACHSGAGRDVVVMGQTFRSELDVGEGIYTIASCDTDQISYDWPEKEHGVFTYFLADAIDSATVAPDGRVTLDAVYDWTRRKVLQWTADKRMRQEPVRICRMKGQIAIGARELSVQEQLRHARDEIREKDQIIARQAQQIEGLAAKLHAGASPRTSHSGPHRPQQVARVPERAEWLSKQRDPTGFYIAFACSVTSVASIGGALCAVPVFQARFAGISLIVAAFVAFTWWFVYYFRVRWPNRYRLECATLCLNAGDHVGGASFAMAMGKVGVDRAAGVRVLVQIADLALKNDDINCAKMLYARACKYWRSPYAERALKALERDT